jgi:hypothetical protein
VALARERADTRSKRRRNRSSSTMPAMDWLTIALMALPAVALLGMSFWI